MKILLIFTFYLISGPVSCFDVIGSSGGSVIIYCTIPKNRGYNGYFCKESAQCVFLESDKTPNSWDHKGRVSVDEISGFLTVIYRDLSLEDTGVYQCGETGERHETLNLNVKSDPCCPGPKTVIGYPGETVTISCSYPEEFKEKPKIFYKQDFDELVHVISTSDSQKYTSSFSETLKKRFSISEDRRSRVISVRISDVVKEDAGDYYCGVSGDEGASNYETFFTKIHLQVTVFGCICVSLLLIGGLTLIFYKLRCCRTGDSAHISQTSGTNDTNDGDYENYPRRTQRNISMSPVDQNNQSDSVYQSLNPNTNQSDSVYQTLNPKTNQSDSVYQTLNPTTN
ncbi:hypothetical protein AMEX_G24733 [Astyanax mexicanus]|uniref:Ig-like domain-containing protein n=1 Tax=Astyanax mexicanus TaxID=7994 RepID=A0A8T2L0K0_ASTMX|nr:hypothetical protein AMEX_G24733 [Astyanax mexicanus]